MISHEATADGMLVDDRSVTRRSPALLIVTLVVAVVLFVLSVRGIRFGDLRGAMGHSRPALLVCAAAALSGSYFARGLRWRIQIGAVAPIGRLTAFWAAMSGYLTNNLLPLRAGEIARPLVTSRITNVSVAYAVAAVLVEHVADFLALSLMTLIAVSAHGVMPIGLRDAGRAFAVVGIIGVPTLIALARMEKMLGKILDRLPVPTAIAHAAHAPISRFLAGLRSLQRPIDALSYTGLTAIVWLLDVATGMAIAQALHLPLAWTQMTLLLVALSLSSAAPSTPANIGIWQFVAVGLLVPLGVSRVDALAYIFVFQIVTFAVETVWGIIGLVAIGTVGARGAARIRSLWSDAPGFHHRRSRTTCTRIAGIMRGWQLCPTAVVSLVSGILGWLVIPVIGAIPATILGHRARWAVIRSGGVLRGEGIATAGLILGYLQLAVLAMLIVVSHLPPQIA